MPKRIILYVFAAFILTGFSQQKPNSSSEPSIVQKTIEFPKLSEFINQNGNLVLPNGSLGFETGVGSFGSQGSVPLILPNSNDIGSDFNLVETDTGWMFLRPHVHPDNIQIDLDRIKKSVDDAEYACRRQYIDQFGDKIYDFEPKSVTLEGDPRNPFRLLGREERVVTFSPSIHIYPDNYINDIPPVPIEDTGVTLDDLRSSEGVQFLNLPQEDLATLMNGKAEWCIANPPDFERANFNIVFSITLDRLYSSFENLVKVHTFKLPFGNPSAITFKDGRQDWSLDKQTLSLNFLLSRYKTVTKHKKKEVCGWFRAFGVKVKKICATVSAPYTETQYVDDLRFDVALKIADSNQIQLSTNSHLEALNSTKTLFDFEGLKTQMKQLGLSFNEAKIETVSNSSHKLLIKFNASEISKTDYRILLGLLTAHLDKSNISELLGESL